MRLIVFVASPLPEHEILHELATGLGGEAEVRLYKDPFELLSGAEHSPPDLLIANGHLNGMSAKELLERFRSFPACVDVPAMVLVGYESSEWREVSFKPGVTEFAIMPVDRDEFTLRSKHLLSSRAQRQPKSENPSPEPTQKAVDDQIKQVAALDGLIQALSAKLLTKISEIDRLRGELQNIVEATSVAAVFLDEQALIRHFTPQIGPFYELSDHNIGKPLQNVPCKLGYSSLGADIHLVQTTGSPIERYLQQNTSETYFLIRISPNRSREKTIWGMTVTFVQINLPCPGRA